MTSQQYSEKQLCIIGSVLISFVLFFQLFSSYDAIQTPRYNPPTTSRMKGVRLKVAEPTTKTTKIATNNNSTTTNNNTTNNDQIDTIIRTQPNIIKKLKLNEQNLRLIHLGKAGGGTFLARARILWNLSIPQCHPFPCREFLLELVNNSTSTNMIEKNQTDDGSSKSSFHNNNNNNSNENNTTTNNNNDNNTNKKGLVITIRDPVDRFVSAFYYDDLITCYPHNESRIVNGGMANINPEVYCQPDYSIINKIREIYKHNVSNLAESICDDTNNSNKIQESAKRHVQRLIHLSKPLSDGWLIPQWTKISNILYPIVLEDGYNFEQQIDNSIIWLYNQTKFESSIQFERRKQYVLYESTLLDDSKNRADKIKKFQHKSTSPSYIRPPLTTKGEECLIKYYDADYRTIKQLRDTACKTDVCIQAIQSSLNRHSIT